ncbi:hypothetical protein, conserved [Eimeria brunetti]|uniref:Transmembrane protein n=1 Tax=Eimeria brunetti TaxID=51314 RepID=U6LQK0_9EIME|nr:hypothetical protein, conserved [Eimeria brunetti]
MSAAAAAGTRRSLLHDVLSHAEVVELGLDGSVDDLPPLTTRLLPPSARAVLLFAWCYFFTFWGAAAFLIHRIISLHADSLLPGAAELIFVAVATLLMVSAEFGVYCYLKAVNPVPINNGPMGNQFSPTPFCTLAHFTLSAASRICSFLELLFLLHAVLLPLPLLACSGFTVSITVGALPLLLQLRCLLGCLFDDRFDPLQLSTCLPLASIERLFLRCGRLCLAGVTKGARGALCHIRRAKGRLGGFLRRGAAVSPGRRVDVTCCPDSRSSSNSSSSSSSSSNRCQANLGGAAGAHSLQAERPLNDLGDTYAAFKEPLRDPNSRGSAECTYTSFEGEGGSSGNGSFADSSCDAASTSAGWRSDEQQQPPPAAHTPQALAPVPSSSRFPVPSFPFFSREGTVDSQPQSGGRQEPLRGPPAPQFISPTAALGLANCLFLLDLPGLTLHVKANFLPLEQLEAHEFLTSIVSLV